MNHKTYPSLKQSFLLVIFFFLSFALYFFLTGTMPQFFGLQLSKLYMTVVFAIASPIATFPLIIYVGRKSGIQPQWPIKLPSIRVIFFLALLAVSAKIITNPLNNPKEYFNHLIDGRLKLVVFKIPELDLNTAIRFFCTVLIVPIFEEIFFRKQVLGLLLRKYSVVLSIVLSSILFAIGHLRFNDIVTLFIWGLLFGMVFYKTKLLEASILLHSFSNFSGFFIKQEFIVITDLQIFRHVSMLLGSVTVIIFIIKYLGRYRTVKTLNDAESPDTT